MANSNRYTAEQPKPKQGESRSWLAMLGEAQIQQAEAQSRWGRKLQRWERRPEKKYGLELKNGK
ncbi:hypothetical protein PAALTS15_18933 [Paenibacillus alvei TS-15]|uniref:Transposase n=1 Tax=Paenibacillus alvei TS-15 TaxID=1117108 RepID=S9U594_PAEAL|nr:hypothetical protein PAALTS15_18933 [Paenibacillus alvei TS-15]